MATGKQESVQLAAGEQATVTCDGTIAFQLGVGAVEYDGVPIAPETTYRLRLSRHRTATFYTLTGATMVIKANVHFTVHKHASRMPALAAVVRSCTAKRTESRLLVLGDRGSGKSTAAKTVLSGILRAHSGDTDVRVVFVEGDTSNGAVCAPGTMAAAVVEPPSLPVESPFLDTVPSVFFTGYLQPTDAHCGHLLHVFAQTADSAEWLLRRGDHRTRHLVVDAPHVPAGTDAPWFLAQVIELVKPTHVVVLAADVAEYSWASAVLARHGKEAVLSVQEPLVPAALRLSEPARENERSFAEYLCGPPSNPLDCATVVAPLNALTFVKADTSPGAAPSAMTRCSIGEVLPGSVVGVSHGQSVEEAGFANVAGLLLVKEVNVANNELVVVAPDIEFIPRPYIVVGDAAAMRCRPNLVAPFSI